MTLKKQGIFTGRGMIRKTLEQKGLDYVSSLALQNIKDLKTIVEWNINHGYSGYRMSSDIFPWHSEYDFEQLRDFASISDLLAEIGTLVTQNRHRLTFHPDHFNKLGSSNVDIVSKTISDIEQHSRVMDLMGFVPSHYNKINIHVGGAYGNKDKTLKTFAKNFDDLSDSAKKRLTVENDDKEALFSVKDLRDLYIEIGTPIVFDYHHHKFNNGGLSQEEAFQMAYETWPWHILPVFHYSESRKDNERAHSDYVSEEINTYGKNVDIVIEAKMKELAVEKICKKDL
jgi:UV DNA damage endonuclease